jgi:hypothetical protein
MSNSTPSSRLASQASADELLYGFDICDEESRDFLCSVIASGQAPQAEREELRELSLMRGVEEWDMLLGCASALCERSEVSRRGEGVPVEGSLLPFLDAVLTGQDAQVFGSGGLARSGNKGEKTRRAKEKPKSSAAKRNGSGKKCVSHFWGDAGEAGEKPGARRLQANALPFATHGWGSTQDTHAAVIKSSSSGADRTLGGVTAPEVQLTIQTTPAEGVSGFSRQDEAVSVHYSEQQNQPLHAHNELVLPNGPSCPSTVPQREVERAVHASRASKSPFFAPSTPARSKPTLPTTPTPPRQPTTQKKRRPPRGTISSLPIPPLSAPNFGLIQEELAATPFRLLIAVTFLIRTAGKAAIPVFWQLMERFPTPEALAAADSAEIIALIQPLGLAVVRCEKVKRYARMWIEKEPTGGKRYGVKGYPRVVDGRGVRAGEEFGGEDGEDCDVDAVVDARERAIGSAWEIGHLTQGPYALDSWRIFCRDVLLGRSEHWTGKGDDPGFQPEWMRVLPRDKELRACLRWMW